MATKQTTVDFILEQYSGAGSITAKKMFGEYGLYCDGKIVALICDDQLYIKSTDAAKIFLEAYVEDAPYPGAKPYLLISGDKWEDHEWLTELINITALALPIKRASKKRIKPK